MYDFGFVFFKQIYNNNRNKQTHTHPHPHMYTIRALGRTPARLRTQFNDAGELLLEVNCLAE